MRNDTREYNRLYYYRRRAKIIEYLGGKCAVCGMTKDLELDHINRADKTFEITQRLSIRNNKAELDKCQLLCRKHHREKTDAESQGFAHGTMYGWAKKKCRCPECVAAWRAYYKRKYGHRNARRLDYDKAVSIRHRVANGETQSAIAEEYGVCCGTIWNIVAGRTWNDSPEQRGCVD